jgi:hypothetical protein
MKIMMMVLNHTQYLTDNAKLLPISVQTVLITDHAANMKIICRAFNDSMQ